MAVRRAGDHSFRRRCHGATLHAQGGAGYSSRGGNKQLVCIALPCADALRGLQPSNHSVIAAAISGHGVTMIAGRMLGGRYRLVREIARGASGAIWCAEHVILRMPVAIKFSLSAHPSRESETAAARSVTMKRFLSEARIAAAVRGPHVVEVLDYGVEQGTPFLVMELLRGETLGARLRRHGRVGADVTAQIVLQVAQALGRMHALGVVHCDLKPENVFLVEGGALEAKLLDFGVATVGDQALRGTLTPGTRAGSLVGSPSYMSPEQLRDPLSLDARSDVWALGVVAFECLLGRLPFRASHLEGVILAICARPAPVPSLLGPVPRGFDAWFARACAKELERRFASAWEAASALDELCRGEPRTTAALASVVVEAEDMPVAWQPSSSGFKRLWSGLFLRPCRLSVPLQREPAAAQGSRRPLRRI